MITGLLGTLSAEDISLSLDEAVKKALDSDWRIQSAYLDKAAAVASTEKTLRDQLYPSLALTAGYSRLSHVTSLYGDSIDNSFSFAANMNYTVFAGFRMREARKLAELQEKGKDISLEITRRTVFFETQRAYWEAARAVKNVALIEQNLDLMKQNLEVTKKKFDSGTILKADLLSAQMRIDQAALDLNKANLYKRKAFLNLQALTGSELSDNESVPSFVLTTDPSPETTPYNLTDSADLINAALESRPESMAAQLAVDMSEAGRGISKSALYPVVTLTGNYTLANPNSRVSPYEAEFNGTWYAGVNLSYDIGRLPSRISELKQKDAEIEKSKADRERQRELIGLDVRNCLLTYRQAAGDMEPITSMLDQARENERVMSQKVTSGTAGDMDKLQASLSRLQAEFAIVNSQIDLQIAAADLERAAALSDLSGK